jgi:phosphoserine aminotransferase
VTAREIGRETSHNLVEIRTVLSRAETALESLHEFRREYHTLHGESADKYDDERCPADCPDRDMTPNENGVRWKYTETRRWSDPDYAEAKEALQATIDALGKFRRTGRPRRG